MLRSNTAVYLIGGFATIGGFLFGYDIGVISGILTMPHFKETFPASSAKEGFIVSSLLAGCFVGALIAGYFCDKIGRRFSILGGSIIFILGAILQATPTKFEQLFLGRIISGISIGVLSMIVPLYQSEISPKSIRGRIVAIQQWAITIGIAVSFWIDYATSHIDSPIQWRIPLGLQAIPAAVLAVGVIFLPYSPRWLMDNDRDDEALEVLARLHGNNDKTAPIVQQEFNEIKENVLFERENALKSYSELWKVGPENIRKRMLLGIFIQFFQQLTGINVIMYYAPQIFQNAGFPDTSASLLATGINGMVNVLATIPAILWVDRWGRRPALISGGFVMATAMFFVGTLLGIYGEKYYDESQGKYLVSVSNKGCSYAVIIFIYMFVAGFAYSWGPIGWMYPAEIFPLRIRGKALSVTTATNWLFNFAVGQLAPTALEQITWGTYIIFCVLQLTMATTVYLFYPETKGLSLEEMDNLFNNSHDIHKEISKEAAEGEKPDGTNV